MWDAVQLNAYCRAALTTLQSLLDSKPRGLRSYALNRAVSNIETRGIHEVYKLRELADYFSTDTFNRLQGAVQFAHDAVALIGAQNPIPATKWRERDRAHWD